MAIAFTSWLRSLFDPIYADELNEARRIETANQLEEVKAATCQCGKPSVVRKTYPSGTPFKPQWGFCDEHKDVPVTASWSVIDGQWMPNWNLSREECRSASGQIGMEIITDCSCGEHIGVPIADWPDGVRKP